MKDLEKIDSILRHIDGVHLGCRLLGERLIENGEGSLGIQLIANSLSHDQSKFTGIEWNFLNSENSNKDTLSIAIEQHNKTNPHHPEFWGCIAKMPDVYLAEMVVDWKTRASEFGTSLLEWINGDAMKRFNFNKDDEVYNRIIKFVHLLIEPAFQNKMDLSTTLPKAS